MKDADRLEVYIRAAIINSLPEGMMTVMDARPILEFRSHTT